MCPSEFEHPPSFNLSKLAPPLIHKAKPIDLPLSRTRKARQKTVDSIISHNFTDMFSLPCSR